MSRQPSRSRRAELGFVTAAALAGLTGCGRDGIQVYTVPKEQAPAVAAAEPESQAPPQVRWTTPAGWQEKPGNRMRAASFAVTGSDGQKAEVAVIPLAGMTGRDLEMVNFWREQVRQPKLGREELVAQAGKVTVGAAGAGQLFEMTSTELLIEEKFRARILVAVLSRPDATWYFTCTGAEALVTEQKPVFVQFLQSIVFEAAGNNLAQAGPARPLSANPKELPRSAEGLGKPILTVPGGWEEQPAGPMQLARFRATDADGGKADISVSVLPGDGGGAVANVNRWRRQIGLPPIVESDLGPLTTALEVEGGKAMLVDMNGVSAEGSRKTRMIAVAVARGGQTWFYKLLGDEAVAAREREALLKFIQSARYPNG